ncbi:MAG: para-aminobenzoate synthetase/4-amino-4-deoxychorismate lyase [Janthinobacterium sp.]|jgi:para-aminobenzoate synthetase/4-amino-4-deoxychorismate lyase
MTHACFALLDDATTESTNSRLYHGHADTLTCTDSAAWPGLLDQMQQALARGQHALVLCTYELGRHLLRIAPDLPASSAPVLAQILLFDHCQRLSRSEVSSWLAAAGGDAAAGDAAAGIAQIASDVDASDFADALARIRTYIEAGDAYQVNYTYRLHFDAFGTLHALYARLRARQSVPYGALIQLPDGSALLSLSPELLLRHRSGELTAQPMKGTAPADLPDMDAQRAAALAADPKNRAENLMIVDLLRNDIGRIAVIGSVEVPALFEVQRHGDVLQMTSTVRARLRANTSLADIFDALYPCGSITGAPKRRSMEIINELETSERGIYTGAIGWFDAAPAAGNQGAIGDFCLSVPIRTLALEAPANGVRSGRMGIGAGIVHDSNSDDEFAECALKARFLTGLGNDFALFETMYASRQHGVRHIERHLARLSASARYFGYPCDVAALKRQLFDACAALPEAGPHRMRLSLDQFGASAQQSAPLAALMQAAHEPIKLLLADAAVTSSDLFLRHKTTQRARYDASWKQAEAQGAFDMLFFNERAELTEGARSNVFVKLGGRWFTPPLSAGVLPGVMRGVLLEDPAWAACEKILPLALLQQAQEIVVCNALRGTLVATIIG